MRLSKDDEKLGESESIQNQRKLLVAYCKENDFKIVDEYIDDGYSGTTFDRPNFKRMISDIEARRINLVITKDFSRLGRDYITTGQYTEIFFPEHSVRYIAINDGYDSNNPMNDIAPFKHVINEMYARDTSKKIRSAFQTKMEEGSYIGNFAPYGYMKDPSDKNHLLVDYEVAPIVSEIFRRARGGESPGQIAKALNDREVLPPALYRCKKFPDLNEDNYSENKIWTSGSICKILKNQVYLGNTAQGKTTKVSFKSDVVIRNDPDDWIVVEGTHEPIIDQLTFDMVRTQSVSRKHPPKTNFKNIFSGIAVCETCGRNMSTTGTRRKGSVYNLVCGRYKLYGSKACSNHFVDYESLYELVRNTTNNVIKNTREERDIILKELSETEFKESSYSLQQRHATENAAKRIKEIDKIIQRLYEDSYEGKITEERFLKMLSTYEDEQRDLTARIKAAQDCSPSVVFVSDTQKYKKFCELIDDISELCSLTREIVVKLIDRIEIGQGSYEKIDGKQEKRQAVTIYYKFIGNPFDEEMIA